MLEHVRESPLTMTLPLMILAVPSVLVGLWGAPQLGNGFAQFLEGSDFHEHGDGLRGGRDSGRCWRCCGIGLAYADVLGAARSRPPR